MTITIIADGSCHTSHKVGAWAALVVVNNPNMDTYSYRIEGSEKTASSYRMEIAPVVAALKTIDPKYRGRVHVLTDHSGLADVINSHVPHRKVEHCQDLLEELKAFTMRYRIKAEFRKGHTGDAAHEWCDKLSKQRSAEMKGVGV